MSLWTPPPEDGPRRLADLRVSYDAGVLDETHLATTPLAQFRSWFEDAVAGGDARAERDGRWRRPRPEASRAPARCC